MIRYSKLLILLAVAGYIISGCSPRSRYESRLKRELASGVRYDSLFMGLYLGMPQKDFYTQCWNLNRKGLVKQGTSNTTVQYKTKDEFKYPATMDFYPGFSNGKISSMPVKFAYTGWAPWNRELSSDKLEEDVLRWYRKIYGPGFISVRDPVKGTAFIKIDGNRRISVYKENDLNVWAVFTDLLAQKDTTVKSVNKVDSINKPVIMPEKK